ncbi:nuclear control of ATPase protein 2 [[Candida] railenensis]|uniref:Nuclear control of ATPase protein 2 n=1 Tax=[Candida] railenensis TaxID=45579 RepID=A0A9P0QLP0_9ASCO|nr:nuclear control of ATPase protein 2 [[Candida] railenensis]
MSSSSASDNIITTKISHSLVNVNKFTNNFLVDKLTPSIEQLNTTSTSQESAPNEVDLLKVQESFQQLYYLVGAQNEGELVTPQGVKQKRKDKKLKTGSSKKNKIPTIKLLELKKILENVKDLKFQSDGSPQQELYCSIANHLNNFVSVYSLMIIYAHLTDTLIDSTISSNEHLLYWDSVNDSNLKKWIYLVQVSPERLFQVVRSIAEDFKKRVLNPEYFENNSFLRVENERGPEEEGDRWPSNTEEDNEFYYVVNRARQLANVLYLSTTKTIKKLMDSLSIPSYLFMQLNSRKSFTKKFIGNKGPLDSFRALGVYSKIIIGAPIRSVSFEIGEKRSVINANIDNIAFDLGTLITRLPTKEFNELDTLKEFVETGASSQVSSIIEELESILKLKTFGSVNEKLYCIVEGIETYKRESTTSHISPPSFWTRNWPIIFILLKFGPRTSLDLFNNRNEIYDWIRLNLYETVRGFINNWLIKPISDMVSVIRHDDSSTEFSITTKESLQSDLDSLERMVVDYALDYEKGDFTSQNIGAIKEEINKAVKEGNLTILMSKYEQDLRTPFKSTVNGSLPRGLLIQLQKTKVDGAIAINGIDKLLKSQQLVFGMVSISPSLIIVYQVWQLIKNQLYNKPMVLNAKQINLMCLKSLNNIEKYLNIYSEVSQDQKTYIEGYLLIEILNLKRQSLKVLPRNIQEMWIKDLNDINDGEWSIEGRLRTMSRIWSVYGHYFR